MVFSSALFLFGFLPIVLFVYFLSHERYRNLILLLASLFFYAWGEPKNVLLMMASIAVNYALGLLINKKARARRLFLLLSLLFNLGMLFYFKYLNFAADIWSRLTGRNIEIKAIALPIGISFFTFQIMSYVIDVYRKNVPAQKNVIDLALYISLFPQLIAGPIVRYIDVEAQIKRRESTWDKAYDGVTRFMIGFSKKVLIADQLSTLVNSVFNVNGVGYHSVISHWVGAVAYALQIYYDFSGYSDMAIGLGKIFGFDFLENFNYPYISKSIKEFWRRWHISLSTWFRDYLYIPLGGNRKGTARTYVNLMIVFLATGIWHGASFNFVIWGLYYAVFLILERIGLEKKMEKLPSALRHLYALLVVLIGWVFFRADTLADATAYIRGMFVPYGRDVVNFNFIMNSQYWFCLATGILFSTPVFRTLYARLQIGERREWLGSIPVIAVFIVAISYMVGSGYSPFLYFRF